MVKRKNKTDKQVFWLIGIMVFVLLIFIFVYAALWNVSHFEYIGLKWEKTKFGKLDVYRTNIIINMPNKNPETYDFYLRNDPRKLEEIPLNAVIRLKQNNFSYVTIDDSLQNCSDFSASLVDLGSFLAAFGIRTKTGVMNQSLAEEQGKDYVICGNKDNSIITYEKAEKTEILQVGDCFQIKVANCEVRKGFERFMLGLIAHSRGYKI